MATPKLVVPGLTAVMDLVKLHNTPGKTLKFLVVLLIILSGISSAEPVAPLADSALAVRDSLQRELRKTVAERRAANLELDRERWKTSWGDRFWGCGCGLLATLGGVGLLMSDELGWKVGGGCLLAMGGVTLVALPFSFRLGTRDPKRAQDLEAKVKELNERRMVLERQLLELR